jgi:hypothetical protein
MTTKWSFALGVKEVEKVFDEVSTISEKSCSNPFQYTSILPDLYAELTVKDVVDPSQYDDKSSCFKSTVPELLLLNGLATGISYSTLHSCLPGYMYLGLVL